jgi:hypothetical protein
VGNEQMNMIGDRTGFEESALLVFDDATHVSVKFIPDVIGQQPFPVLCREDQMYENLGE